MTLDQTPARQMSMGYALSWQAAPCKARALLACHRSASLAPQGWAADRDCLRHGVAHGLSCGQSCWNWMALSALAGHAPRWMGLFTLLAWLERQAWLSAVQAGVLAGLAGMIFWWG